MTEPESTNLPASGDATETVSPGDDRQTIRHLEGLEGIRHRPSMYIGDTGTHGLHHLVFEVVDNSIDEAVNKFATTISVVVNRDNTVTCTDDGRGIPVDPYAKDPKRSMLEVALTSIHAGGKFSREEGYVLGTGGLHGVGLKAVNALSEWTEVEVRRQGHVWMMEFARGERTSELQKLGKTDQTGTKITFKPDADVFPVTKFSYDILHRRLQELAFLTPGVRIKIQDERTGQSDDFRYEKGLEEFVQHLNRTVTPLYAEVIQLAGEGESLPNKEGKIGTIQVKVALQHHDSPSEDVRSFANNVYNPDGGTHLVGFRSALTRTINAYGRKENMFKDITPTGDDFREGLTAIVSIRHPDPQFEAQTKVKLVNNDAESVVQAVVNEQLGKFFEENPNLAKLIVKAGLRAAEAREAAKKARDMVRKNKGLTTGGLPAKLRDCRSRDLDLTELYMVEGDSAGGSADTARDSNVQAVLPLRGKILNVEKAQLVKLLDNAEISAMFKAIGIPPGAKLEDVTKRRYGKIILMMDADIDGSHIRTLLLTFLFRHMRELVKEGCVYIAQPPLYRVEPKGKKSKKDAPPRYVLSHEEMRDELITLGLSGSSLETVATAARLEGDRLRQLVTTLLELEEPLETLERRGVDLRFVAAHHLSENGFLPRYRVFLGQEQHWFASREQVDAFLKTEEQKRGGELRMADAGADLSHQPATVGEDESQAAPTAMLQLIDMHEVRTINEILLQLKDFGLSLHDFIPAGFKNAEAVYPFVIHHAEGEEKLTSLRNLVQTLQDQGEKGLRLTRFKGLGEMNADELGETAMDPETRMLVKITMEDAAGADEIFRVLMGDHVEPRREFIEKHALDVKDLDV